MNFAISAVPSCLESERVKMLQTATLLFVISIGISSIGASDRAGGHDGELLNILACQYVHRRLQFEIIL